MAFLSPISTIAQIFPFNSDTVIVTGDKTAFFTLTTSKIQPVTKDSLLLSYCQMCATCFCCYDLTSYLHPFTIKTLLRRSFVIKEQQLCQLKKFSCHFTQVH